MHLATCGLVTEVIHKHNEGDETDERIIFPNMKKLSLAYMRSLISFCSGDFTLEFPQLEQLEITRCLQMNHFAQGHLIMPMLQQVLIERKTYKLSPNANLNTLVMNLHEV